MDIDFDLPTDVKSQLLVGAVFAESRAHFDGGEDFAEKVSIAQTIVNMAFYAGQSRMNGRRCYNSSFGDGTILSAIKRAIVAYGGTRWNLVMANDRLKSKRDLERVLNQFEVEHLRGSVQAVARTASLTPPVANSGVGRIPVQFNQARDSPPSPRQEKIGTAGAHTFYGFIAGRECQ